MADIMKMGANPNYLGSWDIEEIPNRELTLTISNIIDEKVAGDNGRTEPCTVAYFVEPYKPMILNITNKKRLVKLYKTKETEHLKGKRITITTEKVKAFGDIHDALRIKPVVPTAPTRSNGTNANAKQSAPSAPICAECKKPIKAAFGNTPEQLAELTKGKFGRSLCDKCAIAEADKAKAEKEEKTESGKVDTKKSEQTEDASKGKKDEA